MKKMKTKEVLLLVLVGTLAGVINGMFGAGAGLVLVPMIRLVTKLENKKVHATTLVCVMNMCLINAIIFLTNKQVDFSIFIWCLIGSLVGSFLGTKLLQKLKNKTIDFLFSGLLIASGILMIVL